MNDFTKDYSISIYLDKRRAKKNGKYPVKLRVFTSSPRKQKLYPTKYEFTEAEFESVWVKPTKNFKEERLSLQAIDKQAEEVAKTIKPFILLEFENRLFGSNSKNSNDINNYYQKAIDKYNKNQQISTSSNYDLSLKSLLKYHKKSTLEFYDVTSDWLKGYERQMLADEKSSATIGIYLRPLRAIFNKAIKDGVLDVAHYPFGKDKYVIPSPKGVKKALSKEQLKALYEGKAQNEQQELSKAFWFFSYACNGINFKDMLNLKYKNIDKESLTFVRAKTSNTNKAKEPVKVHLNDYLLKVIDKYGNKDKSPKNLIFPTLNNIEDPKEKKRKLQNFIRLVNQHFLKYSKTVGIDEKISSYWARHSFATNAIRNGASMEFVSEALSHSNLNTTKSYFAGFDDEKKKEISNKLMEF
tara:strand:- start:3840 stop:5075 length:1236 start_codon:yes stop_codon:yes gene_type:complete